MSAADTAAGQTAPDAAPAKPYFRITKGNPTAVEVGILAAVFATAEGNGIAAGETDHGVRDDWGAIEGKLRTPFGYDPGSFLNSRQY